MPRKAKKGGQVSGEELPLGRHPDTLQQEEVNRKREELLARFLEVKVQREERNSRVNRTKLNHAWRVILRQALSEQLRDDIVVLRRSFERQLDGLDDVIQRLSRDLEEAERQCCRVSRLHLHQAERLRTLLDERVTFVRRRWEQSLQEVGRGFAEEREKMAAKSQDQRRDLEEAASTMRRRHNDVMREVHAAYGDVIAALRDAQRERVAALRGADEANREEKLRQRREAEPETKQEVEQGRHPGRLLMSRNQKLINDTGEDVRRVRRLQLSAFQAETGAEADILTKAGVDVAAKTRRLGHHLTGARQASRKRLAALALRTDSATRKLKAVVAKGENVLRAASLCGKLEQATTSWPHGEDDERPGASPPSKTLPDVHRLIYRLNWALLRQDALAQREDELRRDNHRLRLLLRRRLEGAAFGGVPALLAVKAAPTADGPALATTPHNIIEAGVVFGNSLS
ncbi:coiled-coil domain-containing protein 65 isoform X2 [Hippocampus comes]|uniref:coiled-coil domain-containing protein 65 isoform X2 n=1 Tax=Hippocampus comes TaxID=109280 RepID=UPI00094E8191|nr:PREDICTED: coiled-coil domain-containing protein 65 isoform X2 [Hippocampus comes]